MVSVSLDEDLEAWKNMVARKSMNWPQICDGKGANSGLVRLYNAETPTYYVLDQQGRIAAKHTGSRGLEKMVQVIERILSRSTDVQ